MMIRQLRRSGGIWIRSGNANVLVDPGPGSLAHCASSRPRLNPATLDGLILTHRHLDHAGDINVMIEAMTEGGFKKRGILFCPRDALDGDPVVLKYLRAFPARIQPLGPRRKYSCGDFTFETSPRHRHPVETYGLKFMLGKKKVGYMVDTGYAAGLFPFYRVDFLIIGVVLVQPRPEIFHLSLPEVSVILEKLRPRDAVLTHFGLRMLEANPAKLARELSAATGVNVISARDSMVIGF